MAVTKTTEHDMETAGAKTYPVSITRLRSDEPFEYEHGGRVYFVDAVTVTDAGKYGVSTVMTIHQDFTEEEKKAGRRRIQAMIDQAMRQQDLWRKADGRGQAGSVFDPPSEIK